MTDRELLRLAAIACGELVGEWKNNEAYFEGVLSRWNPLNNDGDAQRLMVRMGVEVRFPHRAECVATLPGATVIEAFISAEPSTRHAATRRAIVRAAASIGADIL